MKVQLTKISDDKFEGNHPKGIYKGYNVTGDVKSEPVVGQSFIVRGQTVENWLITSEVTEVFPETNTFKTLNSTYKWEVL